MGTKRNKNSQELITVMRAKIGLTADGELDGNELIGQIKEHAKKIDNLEKHVSRIKTSLEKMTDKIDMLNKNITDIKQSLKGNITEESLSRYYKIVIGLFTLLTAASGFVSYLLYIKK